MRTVLFDSRVPHANFPQKHGLKDMKKARIFIFIFPVLVILLSWLLLYPSIAEILKVREKIRLTRSQIERFGHLRTQSQEIERKIAYFQKDIQHLIRYLPGPGSIETTLKQLHSWGTEYGLNMLKVSSDYSFRLDEAADQSLYANDRVFCLEAVPVQLQAEGQLPDICNYLEWLEELPYFLSIDQAEIRKLEEDSSAVFPRVRLAMLIKIVGLSRQEKEDTGRILRAVDLYQPANLSSALIAAQKNVRLTALEKDLFFPEEVSEAEVDEELGKSEEEAAVSGEDDPPIRKKSRTLAEEGRSPLQDEGRVSVRDFDLNGILSCQGEYIALINNRRVKKGETIAGMEVMWITKDSICLAKGDEKFILRLNQ